ncbi:MAG: tetratricopeptide repeat protein [Acidobacteriota bacterium]
MLSARGIPAFLLAFVLAVAVAGPAAAQGRVSGAVKDETGQPIKDATIRAENPSAVPPDFTSRSDDKGRWSMVGLQNGQWTFTASAPGYGSSTTRQAISYLRTNPTLEFVLKKQSAEAAALAGLGTKELQAELKAADDLFGAKQWAEAVTAYKALLDKVPTLTRLNLQIGGAYRALKDYDRAILAFQEVLKAEPDLERVRIELGNTYMLKGDMDKAYETLSAAANSPEASRELFYNLGEVEFAQGKTDEAAASYQKALDKDPTWVKPMFKLGLVALNRGNTEETIKMMEKVMATDPTSSEAIQAQALITQLKK